MYMYINVKIIENTYKDLAPSAATTSRARIVSPLDTVISGHALSADAGMTFVTEASQHKFKVPTSTMKMTI